jgi:hypothetical protein
MVTRQREDDGSGDARGPTGDRGQPHRDLFETPEAAGRLGQRVETALGLGSGGRVAAADRVTELREQAHRAPSRAVRP